MKLIARALGGLIILPLLPLLLLESLYLHHGVRLLDFAVGPKRRRARPFRWIGR